MKNRLTNNIILIYIVLQPILDMLITITDLPISLIVRGLFFLYVILSIIKNKTSLKISIFIIFLMIFYLSYSYMYLNYGLITSISSTFKLFFLPFTLIYLNNQKQNKNINKALFISLIIYLSIYLLSYIFNIGYNTYLEEEGKSGYRGLFTSINELSAILVILYYYTYRYVNNILKVILTLILLIISYLAGTKVLLGGILLVLFINNIVKLINHFKSKNKKTKIVLSITYISIFMLLVLLFTKTTTYQNMIVQANFFKVNNILSMDGINRVIFNNRLTFLNENHLYFIKQSIINILFGIGYNNPLKLVEIDFFDILYRYGIIGISIIIFIFINIFRKTKISKINLLSIIILILISLTSGHVLISPAVSIYFGIIMWINNSEVEDANSNCNSKL